MRGDNTENIELYPCVRIPERTDHCFGCCTSLVCSICRPLLRKTAFITVKPTIRQSAQRYTSYIWTACKLQRKQELCKSIQVAWPKNLTTQWWMNVLLLANQLHYQSNKDVNQNTKILKILKVPCVIAVTSSLPIHNSSCNEFFDSAYQISAHSIDSSTLPHVCQPGECTRR